MGFLRKETKRKQTPKQDTLETVDFILQSMKNHILNSDDPDISETFAEDVQSTLADDFPDVLDDFAKKIEMEITKPKVVVESAREQLKKTEKGMFLGFTKMQIYMHQKADPIGVDIRSFKNNNGSIMHLHEARESEYNGKKTYFDYVRWPDGIKELINASATMWWEGRLKSLDN